MTVFTSGVGTAYPWDHPSSPTVFSQVPVSVLAVLIVLQCSVSVCISRRFPFGLLFTGWSLFYCRYFFELQLLITHLVHSGFSYIYVRYWYILVRLDVIFIDFVHWSVTAIKYGNLRQLVPLKINLYLHRGHNLTNPIPLEGRGNENTALLHFPSSSRFVYWQSPCNFRSRSICSEQ